MLPPAGEHSSPLRYFTIDLVGAICDRPSSSRVQHILDKNPIAAGGVIHKDVGHRADQSAVLNDRRAGHLCVKDRTKFCTAAVRFAGKSITATGWQRLRLFSVF